MRIQLSLCPKHKLTEVPLNYAYSLSAAIYNILKQASPEYAAFLHNRGYRAPSGRLMKMFVFSKLWIPNVRRHGGVLIGSNDYWFVQVSSPMLDEFVQKFVVGLFASNEIAIVSQEKQAVFWVEQVDVLPMPEFCEIMRFKCLSPITAKTVKEYKKGLGIYYYRPYDSGLSEALRKNLLQKYEIIHSRPLDDARLNFRLEASDKPKSKLITIKEGTSEATQIKSFETYFTLEGNPELIRTAWECGLGGHNSQGFGMLDVVR